MFHIQFAPEFFYTTNVTHVRGEVMAMFIYIVILSTSGTSLYVVPYQAIIEVFARTIQYNHLVLLNLATVFSYFHNFIGPL